MSIHHTLRITLKSKKQRSVLKRLERIRHYISKGSFNEQSSVLGLPKIKSFKIKIKKEKSEEKSAAATGATPASAGASTQAKAAPKGASAK